MPGGHVEGAGARLLQSVLQALEHGIHHHPPSESSGRAGALCLLRDTVLPLKIRCFQAAVTAALCQLCHLGANHYHVCLVFCVLTLMPSLIEAPVDHEFPCPALSSHSATLLMSAFSPFSLVNVCLGPLLAHLTACNGFKSPVLKFVSLEQDPGDCMLSVVLHMRILKVQLLCLTEWLLKWGRWLGGVPRVPLCPLGALGLRKVMGPVYLLFRDETKVLVEWTAGWLCLTESS